MVSEPRCCPGKKKKKVMKRSRPQGLGTSSAKKEKPEAEAEDVQKDTQDNITEVPEAQVKVVEEPARTFFELPEDATALDQLKALFEFSQMNSGTHS